MVSGAKAAEESYPAQRTPSKRSFDVAFLVAPDENLARRQSAKLRGKEPSSPQNLTTRHYETEQSRSPRSAPSNGPYASARTLTPTLPELSPEPEGRRYDSPMKRKTPSPPFGRLCCESRSAFTKVVLRSGFEDGQHSPRSSISPESYQSSVSPPMAYKYASGFPPSAKMPYPFMVSEAQQGGSVLENLKMPHETVRPGLPYPNLPYSPIVFPPMAEALARPRFLATAGVAGLLPPSFAALALPAQNVCAKCNLSFRMTSDLVYHMRSHHKSESVGESARRRREDKLRCPVCDESFRERHHLTRHMTAHQDKESDAIVDQVELKRRAVHGK